MIHHQARIARLERMLHQSNVDLTQLSDAELEGIVAQAEADTLRRLGKVKGEQENARSRAFFRSLSDAELLAIATGRHP